MRYAPWQFSRIYCSKCLFNVWFCSRVCTRLVLAKSSHSQQLEQHKIYTHVLSSEYAARVGNLYSYEAVRLPLIYTPTYPYVSPASLHLSPLSPLSPLSTLSPLSPLSPSSLNSLASLTSPLIFYPLHSHLPLLCPLTHCCSKDILNRWAYPLVPDIFAPTGLAVRFKRNHVYIEDGVILARLAAQAHHYLYIYICITYMFRLKDMPNSSSIVPSFCPHLMRQRLCRGSRSADRHQHQGGSGWCAGHRRAAQRARAWLCNWYARCHARAHAQGRESRLRTRTCGTVRWWATTALFPR